MIARREATAGPEVRIDREPAEARNGLSETERPDATRTAPGMTTPVAHGIQGQIVGQNGLPKTAHRAAKGTAHAMVHHEVRARAMAKGVPVGRRSVRTGLTGAKAPENRAPRSHGSAKVRTNAPSRKATH